MQYRVIDQTTKDVKEIIRNGQDLVERLKPQSLGHRLK